MEKLDISKYQWEREFWNTNKQKRERKDKRTFDSLVFCKSYSEGYQHFQMWSFCEGYIMQCKIKNFN